MTTWTNDQNLGFTVKKTYAQNCITWERGNMGNIAVKGFSKLRNKSLTWLSMAKPCAVDKTSLTWIFANGPYCGEKMDRCTDRLSDNDVTWCPLTLYHMTLKNTHTRTSSYTHLHTSLSDMFKRGHFTTRIFEYSARLHTSCMEKLLLELRYLKLISRTSLTTLHENTASGWDVTVAIFLLNQKQRLIYYLKKLLILPNCK